MPRAVAKKVAAKRKPTVSDTNTKRLDRIEQKVDELHSLVVALTRVEERLTTVFKKQATIDDKISDIEKDVKTLSEKIGNGFVEKIFWVVLASAVGFLAAQIGAV